MEDDEQMKEVERLVMEEELVLLIVSPMCRSFSKLIKLTRVAGGLNEVKHKDLLERCVRHLRFCFRMYEVQRDAGRLFLHEHPWTTWSWDISSVTELKDKDDLHLPSERHAGETNTWMSSWLTEKADDTAQTPRQIIWSTWEATGLLRNSDAQAHKKSDSQIGGTSGDGPRKSVRRMHHAGNTRESAESISPLGEIQMELGRKVCEEYRE